MQHIVQETSYLIIARGENALKCQLSMDNGQCSICLEVQACFVWEKPGETVRAQLPEFVVVFVTDDQLFIFISVCFAC